MNQPPPRHPLFVAIACIALVGAWSTGAHEAETGESVALLAPVPERIATDCQGVRGATRALCLFEAGRPSSLLDVHDSALMASPPGAAAASGLRVATRPLPSGLATP